MGLYNSFQYKVSHKILNYGSFKKNLPGVWTPADFIVWKTTQNLPGEGCTPPLLYGFWAFTPISDNIPQQNNPKKVKEQTTPGHTLLPFFVCISHTKKAYLTYDKIFFEVSFDCLRVLFSHAETIRGVDGCDGRLFFFEVSSLVVGRQTATQEHSLFFFCVVVVLFYFFSTLVFLFFFLSFFMIMESLSMEEHPSPPPLSLTTKHHPQQNSRRLSLAIPPLSLPSGSSFDSLEPPQRRRSETAGGEKLKETFTLSMNSSTESRQESPPSHNNNKPTTGKHSTKSLDGISMKDGGDGGDGGGGGSGGGGGHHHHHIPGVGPLFKWKKEKLITTLSKKKKKIPGIDGEKVIGGSYEEPTLPQHSPFSSKSPSPITFENKTTKKKHVLIRQPSISDPHLRKKVPPELLQRNNRAHRPRSPSHNSAPISSSGTVYPPVDRNKINPSTHHSFSFLASASSSQIRFLLEKMVDKLEGEERNLLVATLVILHGHPIELFEECLREESTKEPRVETLMRLTSPSVVVLSAITKPFLSSLLDLATPLIELAHTLTQKDIDSLLPFNTPSPPLSPAFSPTLSATSPHRNFQLPSPPSSFTSSFNSSTESVGSSYFSCSSPTPPPTMNSPPLNSLSSNLFNCISHLLTPTSFQLFYLFHILCFRASHVVSNTGSSLLCRGGYCPV